jgi:hypothetical protein
VHCASGHRKSNAVGTRLYGALNGTCAAVVLVLVVSQQRRCPTDCLHPFLLNLLDTASGDPPQLRCTCISPAYQPAGSGTP